MSIMSTRPTSNNASAGPNPARRILFLDDDPARAEIFLAENPEAVWVETASECIARLEEPWDEVHLDHDLGGERFVDLSREDCGMEVVRWLCLEPHPHLLRTQFLVHSHNPVAAGMMAMQIRVSGFQVESRPFGVATNLPHPEDPFWNPRPAWHEWLSKTVNALAASLRGRKTDPYPPLDETGETTDREHR